MAQKKVIELEVKEKGMDEFAGKAKTLKSQLREMKDLLGTMDENSVAFKNLQREAGALEDKIGDINQEIKNFASDTGKVDVALQAVGAAAGAFGAVQGGMALFGVESEGLEKSMVKLQAAMSLVNSVQAIHESLNKSSALTQAIKTTGTYIAATAEGVYTFAVGASTGAIKLLRIAMLSLPIFAIIAGIVAIADAMGAFGSNSDEAAEKTKRLEEAQDEARIASDKLAEAVITEASGFIKLSTAIKNSLPGSKERATLVKQMNDKYGTTLKNISDEKKFQEQLNLQVKNYIEFTKARLTVKILEGDLEKNLRAKLKLEEEKEKLDAEKKANERLSKKIKALDDEETALMRVRMYAGSSRTQIEIDVTKKLNKLQEQAANTSGVFIDMQVQQNNLLLSDLEKNSDKITNKIGASIKEVGKFNLKTGDEEAKPTKTTKDKDKVTENKDLAKSLEELTAKNIAFGKTELDLLVIAKEAMDTQIQAQFLTSTDKDREAQRTAALLANEEDFTNKKGIIKAKEIAITDGINAEIKAREIASKNELLAIIEGLQEEGFQAGLTDQQRELQAVSDKYFELEHRARDNAEQLKIITENRAREEGVINEKYAEKEKQLAADVQNSKLQMASDAIGAISGLMTAFAGKDEASQKRAFKINKAASIAQASISTYLAVTAALTAGGNPIKLATGAQFVEAGIAAAVGLANVVKISKTKFEGGGGGGEPPSPTATASVNAPSFNVVGNSGINQLGQLGQSPIQAYVVSGEVTSQQALDRNRLQNATL